MTKAIYLLTVIMVLALATVQCKRVDTAMPAVVLQSSNGTSDTPSKSPRWLRRQRKRKLRKQSSLSSDSEEESADNDGGRKCSLTDWDAAVNGTGCIFTVNTTRKKKRAVSLTVECDGAYVFSADGTDISSYELELKCDNGQFTWRAFKPQVGMLLQYITSFWSVEQHDSFTIYCGCPAIPVNSTDLYNIYYESADGAGTTLTDSGYYTLGTRAIFTCSGYLVMDGHDTSECLRGGEWSAGSPKCVEPTCAELIDKKLNGKNIIPITTVNPKLLTTARRPYKDRHFFSELRTVGSIPKNSTAFLTLTDSTPGLFECPKKEKHPFTLQFMRTYQYLTNDSEWCASFMPNQTTIYYEQPGNEGCMTATPIDITRFVCNTWNVVVEGYLAVQPNQDILKTITIEVENDIDVDHNLLLLFYFSDCFK